MTCFVARLNKKAFFKPLGIEVTRENAKMIELELARIVGRRGEHCPGIWKEMKLWLDDPAKKAELEARLRRELAGNK